MIKEDYVSFETAKLLKENGFDGETNCYYIEGSIDKNLYYSPIRLNHNKKITNNEFDVYIDITSSKISAPTLQMAMKWLREVHNICISVDVKIGGGKYYVCISSTENGLSHGVLEDEVWDTFEEACEAAIKYCLENLI